jgi:Putative phage abortive infection protein
MTTNQDTNKNWLKKHVWSLDAVIIVLIVLAGGCFAFGLVEWFDGQKIYEGGTKEELERLGNFGSYLQGTVASLWALAGVILIVVTFLGQLHQLNLQRAELRDTKEQFELQQEANRKERFETTFFQLLNFQRQIVDGLYCTGARGRSVFSQMQVNFGGEFDNWLRGKFGPTASADKGNRELVVEFFEWYLTNFIDNFGSYFSNLYHIFKFVAESSIEPKRRYTSLVRAQLSVFEINYLLYNGLTEKGKGFAKFIKDFGLLEHYDERQLLHPSHKDFYPKEAYQ